MISTFLTNNLTTTKTEGETMKIINTRKNIMGTLSIEAKFNGMRKSQEFIIYPVKAGESPDSLLIQSDTRIGRIDLNTGVVTMSPPRSGGSYNVHLMFATAIDTLDKEELTGLKFRLIQTASKMAGDNGVIYSDNSGVEAVRVF